MEKVGNLLYFFPFNELYCDSGCPLPLRCYNDNQLNFVSKEPYVLPVPCDFIYTGNSVFFDKTINLYPNPSEGIIFIELAGGSDSAFIDIFNSSGQTIFQDQMLNSYKYQVDLSAYPQGLYFIIIADKEGYTFKNIIKN